VSFISKIKMKLAKLSSVCRLLSDTYRMVWTRRDLEDHLVQPLSHGQGHLPPDQAAQSPIQPGLEHCQGGSSHNFSGQLCLIPTCPCKKSLSILPAGPLQVLEGCYNVTLEPSLLQAQQSQLSQLFLLGEVLHPSDHFCAPPLNLLQQE